MSVSLTLSDLERRDAKGPFSDGCSVYVGDVVWDRRVLGQDRSETKKISFGLDLGLAGLVLCCETRSCHAHRRNDLEGHSNFTSTIYSFSVLCLEHHYCGNQWRLLTSKLNPPSAFLYFRWFWSWSSEFGLVYITDIADTPTLIPLTAIKFCNPNGMRRALGIMHALAYCTNVSGWLFSFL